MGRRKSNPTQTITTEDGQEITFTLPRSVKVYKKGEPIPPIIWRVKTIPEQRLRDKMARDLALDIIGSRTDIENKKFIFDKIQNIDTVPVEITFKQAAEMYGWKSFTFDMNNQIVVPVWKDNGADEI